MKDWLAERAAVTPQKLALIMGVETWTYADLDEMVGRTAVSLIHHGIQPGDYVATLLPNSLEYVCLIHAMTRIGAVLVPLNTRLTTAELQWQIEHVGCKWLAHDETFEEKVRELKNCRLLLVNGQWSMETVPLAIDDWQFTTANLQAIVFTSGTTGQPKGAMLTFANHFWSATASSYRLGIEPNDRWLSVLPLYHVGGLAVIFRSCLYGTAVILHNGFHLDSINHSLDTQQITLISLVPTMLYRLLQSRRHWPDSLRLILLGGAAATPELINQANSYSKKSPVSNLPSPIVAPTYGLTEAASQVATMQPEWAVHKPGSVGKPLMFTTVTIVDDEGQELPPGEVGEIVVTGPTVMAGYFNPQISDFLKKSDISLQTGDIGYLDADGDLWVVNRRTDLIVSGGENVYPAEVEAVLRRHTAVSQACVVGIAHPEWGQQVAAMVQVSQGQTVTEKELVDFSQESLAGYKQPRHIFFVEELPKTASGKIARRNVTEQLAELIKKS